MWHMMEEPCGLVALPVLNNIRATVVILPSESSAFDLYC
jgi:hypothetical protein